MPSLRRLIRAAAPSLCVLAVSVLATSTVASRAFADIGTTLAKSEARSSSHAAKHQGRHPLFKTDADGEAPVGGWTKPEAMSLVKDLVPRELRSQSPRRLKAESESGGEILQFHDGTTVWLEYASVNASYRLVAVWTSEYHGQGC